MFRDGDDLGYESAFYRRFEVDVARAHWCVEQLTAHQEAAKHKQGIIYTKMTKRALLIALEAHKKQVDKTGMPYILHPLHLAEQMKGEIGVCAALLHDVIEDTDITPTMLLDDGISQEVVEVLKLLTHTPDEPYMDYIRRIKTSGNPVAVSVKLADLRHNSDLTRLNGMKDFDEAMERRYNKYMGAIKLLEEGCLGSEP